MKFFVDTADVGEIRAIADLGYADGVTTNPSLIRKAARPMKAIIAEICALTPGPVSAEVSALDADGMIAEGRVLAKIAANVVVKAPLTWDGLKACRVLAAEGIPTNLTLCFTSSQALLAAKAGAAFVSPFVGRLDDAGADGVALIGDIRAIYDRFGCKTEVLAASIRSPEHVVSCALAGADAVTAPPATIRALVEHPLTRKGLETFTADWAATGQAIV